MTDEIVVLHDARVRVKLAAVGQRDQVPAFAVVGEQHAIARGEVHCASTLIGAPMARARIRQNAQITWLSRCAIPGFAASARPSPGVGAPHTVHARRSSRSSAESGAKRSCARSKKPNTNAAF